MRIESVTIQGFRGFNKEQTVDFHPSLTLIYGPNSYGKTSISEAFEWLLYGMTSKVERADSKEEYKGCYRNSHLPAELIPFVKALFFTDSNRMEFRAELTENDEIKRFVNSQVVDSWPFPQSLSVTPRPFILQHALKYLLLVKPDERFQRFAILLGLEELDQIQRNVVSLCTKPEACIPSEVERFIAEINSLEARLANQSSLKTIHNLYKKGKQGLLETYKAIDLECERRVPSQTLPGSVLPQLLKIREEAVGKIFAERITLPDYSAQEKLANIADNDFFIKFVTDEFIKEYKELIAISTVEHVFKRAQFYGIGRELLQQAPSKCPFCGQQIDRALSQHIQKEHEKLDKESEHANKLERQRQQVIGSLSNLRSRLTTCQSRHTAKVGAFLNLKKSLNKLSTILAPKHEAYSKSVENALRRLDASAQTLENSYKKILELLQQIEASIQHSREDPQLIKTLAECLMAYVKDNSVYAQAVTNNVPPMADA